MEQRGWGLNIMQHKKIQPKKIYEEVAESIIEMIKTKQLKPGAKLDSVEQLAENFGVGLSAIREALSGLRSMGLVETRQGKGTYLKSFDPSHFVLPVKTAFLMKMEDTKDLYEMRKILESGMAGSAAQQHEPDDITAIEKALRMMENAEGNEAIAAKADLEFHQAITQATHNKLLIQLMDSWSDMIEETIEETRKVLLYAEGDTRKILLEHEAIFQAIKNQDVIQAQVAMHKHLERVNSALLETIDESKLRKEESASESGSEG